MCITGTQSETIIELHQRSRDGGGRDGCGYTDSLHLAKQLCLNNSCCQDFKLDVRHCPYGCNSCVVYPCDFGSINTTPSYFWLISPYCMPSNHRFVIRWYLCNLESLSLISVPLPHFLYYCLLPIWDFCCRTKAF